jgi:NAD(P)-dependent dehydrogenase (short-subunit alcohol dehydrogenase family)
MIKDISLSHKGKSVVVTGCNGQIGRELCKQYVNFGAKVIGMDVSEKQSSDLTMKDFTYFNSDIRQSTNIEKSFEEIKSRFGSIDILINNAGVATFDHYTNRSEDQLDLMMDVNLKGTFNCIRAFIIHSTAESYDRSILNIGSIYGVVSPDFRIYSEGDRRSPEMYGATKAGVIQMTKYFAVDLAKSGIRVNSISPGGVFNPESPQDPEFVRNYIERSPMGRMATESEIASVAIFLTSNLASYITGQNLLVDGGYSVL